MIEKYIDYIDDPKDTYEQYLEKAKIYRFRCVFARPETIVYAKSYLKDTDIIIAGAVDFPAGEMTLKEKLQCFENYIQAGFQEIDYVINQQHIESQDFLKIQAEMQAIHELCKTSGIMEKAIVEMCKLDEYGKRRICEIAKVVKPAYLKTSTGKSFQGACLEDVVLMKAILKDEVNIKAAGGIHHYEQAMAFLAAGASVIGASAGIQIVEEEKAASIGNAVS